MNARVLDSAGTTAGTRLIQRYSAVRAATVALARPLTVEDQTVQPCEEASPTKRSPLPIRA